jgi:hypothetical protein
MAYDAALAARVRALLAGHGEVAEVRMMGGLCFMLGDHMCCGIRGSDLMVRVGAEAREAALAEPHVRPFTLGTGRRQPAGFVVVEPAGVRDDAVLAGWLGRGRIFVATLPPKAAKARR